MPVGYTDESFTCENVSSDSLAPIVIMLLLVPFTRNAVLSMAIGIWIGWCIYERGAWFGTLNFVSVGIPEGIAGYNAVLNFLWLFMGIVGIGLKAGGFEALADVLVKFIKDSYTGQLVTYLFGFLIFFDDYANTIIVGNIIVPATDKMRVSREKLSFIVDCTAAPIASLFMISTWVAYELSLIDEALTLVDPPYTATSSNLLFITSIGERYYAWFMLFFVFMMSLGGRDWGPM
jgi:Na+/H+ antiporter NhaC